MLVLTRKSGEGIWIGDKIRIVVVDIREGQVKLGIDASRQTPIYRDEVYEKVRGANVEASEMTKSDFELVKRSFRK